MLRTIYIADAASPLGRACAIRLGRAGWNVVMGASSLSGLKPVCDELPDHATLPRRCIPTDIGNVHSIVQDAEATFGSLDAVLMNYRPRRKGHRRVVDGQIRALIAIADASEDALSRSKGHFVIMGGQRGAQTLRGAMETVARDALRTLSGGLAEDWRDQPIELSLIEPNSLDGPKQMARHLSRILNGAPMRRSDIGQPLRALSTRA